MPKNIAQQTLIEHQMLKHLIDALRTVLGWNPPPAGMPRKLSTLRFVTNSLQRHLEHMLALEEKDGYMPEIVQNCPQLSGEVKVLRRQHDEFRQKLEQIVAGLDGPSVSDEQQFTSLCEQLAGLLDQLNEHSIKETSLVQEAFLREEGGEG